MERKIGNAAMSQAKGKGTEIAVDGGRVEPNIIG
jgi:hypothetical protein